MNYFLTLIQILFIPVLSPMIIGIIRKIKARLQNRQGAKITQPYYDLWKLFHKNEVWAKEVSWVFRLVPFFLFAISLVIGISIPIFNKNGIWGGTGDFLTVLYLVALSAFLLAIAGMDTGTGFGGTGASREMTMAALTEGGLLFSILAVAVVTHQTNFVGMVNSLQGLSVTKGAPLILAFVAFFISMLAENARYPFDNPATHLELTMIHEAMILEYSGKRLALIEWSAYNKLLIFLALGSSLFFPWGFADDLAPTSLIISLALALIKILILAGTIGVIESVMPKLRFFRLPDVLFTSFVLGAIAILLTIV
ncbi:NADH-quinone oxidoreductase subunit H [Candidatus Uhrbacteria bacterium]|nr:NADH-quinone oxidoreductase subunit H [Candidatus Uhrbacteria bacterium]